MEVEDPISAKFRTVIEALMIKTTSEIVKAFAGVILETRMEISRSWREIDNLKHELEQREKPRADSSFINQTTQATYKNEDDDMVVFMQDLLIPESPEGSGEAQTLENAMTEETRPEDNRQNRILVLEQGTPETLETGPEAQVTQLESRHKSRSLSTSTTETGRQDEVVTGKTAVVLKKKSVQKKNSSTQSNGVKHMLRDRRHLLSSQKPCLCCTSSQCPEQQSESKKNSLSTSRVYTCTDCGKKFQERIVFKNHECSRKLNCSRCGQKFTSLRTLTSHSQSIPPSLKNPFPYKCYLCEHMFATQCGWNIHKRIHAHSHISSVVQQDIPSTSHSFPVPKVLKTKVEVRLERISEAQLEAALFPKDTLILDDISVSSMGPSENLPSLVEPMSSTGSCNKQTAGTSLCQASGSGIDSSLRGRQSNDGTEDYIFTTASSENHPLEKCTQSKSSIANRGDRVEYDEDSSNANEDLPKGLNSLSRKRRISDCNHDIHDGVFPVEKVLRWRNTKGRNEVRIKWMPCSLCGAKWKNTWEPAESFISYKDDEN